MDLITREITENINLTQTHVVWTHFTCDFPSKFTEHIKFFCKRIWGQKSVVSNCETNIKTNTKTVSDFCFYSPLVPVKVNENLLLGCVSGIAGAKMKVIEQVINSELLSYYFIHPVTQVSHSFKVFTAFAHKEQPKITCNNYFQCGSESCPSGRG